MSEELAPGWYVDYSDEMRRERYFDGERWTKRMRWPENPTFEQRQRMQNGGRLPDWYSKWAWWVIAAVAVPLAAIGVVLGEWEGLGGFAAFLVGMYLISR